MADATGADFTAESGHDPKDAGDRPLRFILLGSHQSPTQIMSMDVRKQAMRDFHWRRRHAHIDRVKNVYTPTANLAQPDQLKGRFRLDRCTYKARATPLRKKQPKAAGKCRVNGSMAISECHAISDLHSQNTTSSAASHLITRLNGKYDPFDAFGLQLYGGNLKLVEYYYRGYRLNIRALDISESDFFPSRPAESAKFYAVLNLVAFDYTTRCGLAGQDVSYLHLTLKTYQLVNQRICEQDYSDTTISAVALIATKEVLCGNCNLAAQHMRGLEALVTTRGGIKNISGIHQKVIRWADLCASAWHNSHPFIPRPSASSTSLSTGSEDREPSASASTLMTIFESLGLASNIIDQVDNILPSRRTLSSRVFAIEHDIRRLIPVHSETAIGATLSTTELRIVLLCISAQLYLYLVIRSIPFQSQLIIKLVKRLQGVVSVYIDVFPGLISGHINDNSSYSEALLWSLFVGYAASQGSISEQQWFEQKLRMQAEVSNQLFVDGRIATLEVRLKKLFWHEPWCRPHYQRLLADLGSQQSEQSMLV